MPNNIYVYAFGPFRSTIHTRFSLFGPTRGAATQHYPTGVSERLKVVIYLISKLSQTYFWTLKTLTSSTKKKHILKMLVTLKLFTLQL